MTDTEPDLTGEYTEAEAVLLTMQFDPDHPDA